MAKVTPDLDEVRAVNAAMDALRPSGRVGRSEGIFCSVSLSGLARWTSSNLDSGVPHQPRRLRHEGPEPYVYPVLWYEIASATFERFAALPAGDPGWERWEEMARRYWEAGVPLSDYVERQHELDALPEWARGGHEALVLPEHVRSHQRVSLERLADSCGQEILERDLRAAARGMRRVALAAP
jgi:hypothetical protein